MLLLLQVHAPHILHHLTSCNYYHKIILHSPLKINLHPQLPPPFAIYTSHTHPKYISILLPPTLYVRSPKNPNKKGAAWAPLLHIRLRSWLFAEAWPACSRGRVLNERYCSGGTAKRRVCRSGHMPLEGNSNRFCFSQVLSSPMIYIYTIIRNY